MNTPNFEAIQGWMGRTLVDADGDKVGKIGDIYVDGDTGQPEWALVDTGLFGTRSTFVPIAQARAEGDSVQVSYAKAQIKDAPSVEPDGELSDTEEGELYRHYGLAEPGTEVSDPDADGAMTRSEEQLEVDTRTRQAGRARLRKHVVTENVTTTLPVQREEVRLEREPITEANADAALSGADITSEEHEVTLHEEEAVVAKRVVPKERVRLDTDTVTEQAAVSEQVRKEVIEADMPETARDGLDH
jgi:uncharacterized protein (TIGR02271 family)